MRVFVYEFVTGGGWYSEADEPPSGSLLAEGRAMLTAVAEDFGAVQGVTVDVLQDARLPRLSLRQARLHEVASASAERATLGRLAAEADWTLLIAPEFSGHLLDRLKLVEGCKGRLLSPASPLVTLAADKHCLAVHLAAAGVPVPGGRALAAGETLPADFPFPAVIKPRDGAGSLDVRVVKNAHDVRPLATPARIEAFCPGIAASVACLCGAGRIVPLAPCLQRLGGEQDFTYLGGSLPIEPSLADRATRLAVAAVQTLPEPRGYLGVDLVLGDDPSGRRDFLIEINPRLTTSYVGLRALARSNLAAAMIAVAEGRAVELCWKSDSVHFSSSGVCGLSAPGELVS